MSKDLKDQRADYVKECVNNSKQSVTKEVTKLSKKLFITERTIYSDLKK